MVEHSTANWGVPGSNPGAPSFFFPRLDLTKTIIHWLDWQRQSCFHGFSLAGAVWRSSRICIRSSWPKAGVDHHQRHVLTNPPVWSRRWLFFLIVHLICYAVSVTSFIYECNEYEDGWYPPLLSARFVTILNRISVLGYAVECIIKSKYARAGECPIRRKVNTVFSDRRGKNGDVVRNQEERSIDGPSRLLVKWKRSNNNKGRAGKYGCGHNSQRTRYIILYKNCLCAFAHLRLWLWRWSIYSLSRKFVTFFFFFEPVALFSAVQFTWGWS